MLTSLIVLQKSYQLYDQGSYGCTKEACQFRDAIAGAFIQLFKITQELKMWTEKDTFKPGKVQIIGLSRDSVEKQKQFVEKEKLTVSVSMKLLPSNQSTLHT